MKVLRGSQSAPLFREVWEEILQDDGEEEYQLKDWNEKISDLTGPDHRDGNTKPHLRVGPLPGGW